MFQLGLFLIFILPLVLEVIDGASTRPGNSCGLIKLKAGRVTKEFTSPGYPILFAAQTQCTWLIEAPGGERVRLTIHDFFLTKQARCEGQYVLFSDDLTNHAYGPICGRRGREEIISVGNKLRIKLESDAISRSKNYKGFKFLYSKTTDKPTLSMRDRDGTWKKLITAGTAPRTTTAKPTVVSPTDNIVDENDNARINGRNQRQNERHRDESMRTSGDNVDDNPGERTVAPTPPKKRKPTRTARIPPNRRVIRKPVMKYPVPRRPPTRREPAEDTKNEDGGLSTPQYLTIVVFVIIAIVAFVLIFLKVRKRKQKKTLSNTSSQDQDLEQSPKIQTHLNVNSHYRERNDDPSSFNNNKVEVLPGSTNEKSQKDTSRNKAVKRRQNRDRTKPKRLRDKSQKKAEPSRRYPSGQREKIKRRDKGENHRSYVKKREDRVVADRHNRKSKNRSDRKGHRADGSGKPERKRDSSQRSSAILKKSRQRQRPQRKKPKPTDEAKSVNNSISRPTQRTSQKTRS